jgi:hypothetical protein
LAHQGDPAKSPAPGAAAETAPAPAERPIAAWLRARLPPGGTLVERVDRSLGIEHTVQDQQTIQDVADAYLDLTSVYLVDDLAREIRGENHLARRATPEAGQRLTIPDVLQDVPERLGWPDDDGLRGLHVRSVVAAGPSFGYVLDRMASRRMNLVVLDVKDADGRITYPSNVPLAKEIGAVSHPALRSLAHTIQFAHAHGVRVAMRIVCFADDLLSLKRGDLAVQSVKHRPLHAGWLDPRNETVQNYVLDLVAESLEAGADEIQLDYVRYPVTGVEGADFGLEERGLTRPDVITAFAHRVHEMTRARGVPLTLDIFGIVAEGIKADLEHLGQDPPRLARECEVLAPMVYPSHYPKGFMDFEEPGEHPELVRIGVRRLLALIRRGQPEIATRVRPWIQGMPYRAPSFGPKYILEEVNHANRAGAAGWMLWNPAQDFAVTWDAIAPMRQK